MLTAVASVIVDPSRPTGITPYGLFSVGPVLPLSRAVAVEWESRICVNVEETVSACFSDPVGSAPGEKDLTGLPTWQVSPPFALYAASDCLPDPLAESDARVRDQMVASEQFGVERYFHREILSAGPTSVGTGLSVVESVGTLEQELAARYGVPGVIHMDRRLFTIADEPLDTATTGGVLRTKLGTAIVAGGGYDSEDVMYGTGPIRVFRSDPIAVTEAFDRENNRDVFLAERSYVVAADLCDVVIAVDSIALP